MIAALKCDKMLLVQAELDGELDAAEAAALAVHRQECAICQGAAAELTRARALIGDDLYQPVRDIAPGDCGRDREHRGSDQHPHPARHDEAREPAHARYATP